MISTFRSSRSTTGRSARRTLVGLCLLLFSTLAFGAGGGGGGGNTNSGTDPDGSTNASSPGDDVTSLPLVENTAGLTMIGTVRELRALHLTLVGLGRMSVERQGRGVVAVTLVGDYGVELDRDALARSNVQFIFRGSGPFQGGVARLVVGSSAPLTLPPDRVLLPVGRLASSLRAMGNLVTLDVFGVRGQRAHVEAVFLTDRVVLVQREN